jgi:anti-sigma factor RsiW
MRPTDDTACRALDARILDYLTGALSATERESFEAHLTGCARCQRQFEQVRAAAYLSCQELVELVTDYLEDRLPPAECERFEGHLALCPGCDTYVEQMRETICLTGKLTEAAIAPAARDTLLAAFRDWKRG